MLTHAGTTAMTDAYSDRELEAMMADLESDRVERKESLQGDSPARIREAVCAFANDLPDHRRPGVVFVGADDDGRPKGIEVTDELLRRLADVKTDGNIVPPPTLTVGKHVLSGQDVAVVTVRPSDSPPVRYRGRTWIRVGPRRAVASAQDERILSEKRRHRDPHFDARPVRSAGLADLGTGRFEDEYLPAAVDPETLAANDRTIEERLAAAKMIVSADDPVPTVAGLLVLGKRPLDHLPGAYVQFLRIGGSDRSRPDFEDARPLCRGDAAMPGTHPPCAPEYRRRMPAAGARGLESDCLGIGVRRNGFAVRCVTMPDRRRRGAWSTYGRRGCFQAGVLRLGRRSGPVRAPRPKA